MIPISEVCAPTVKDAVSPEKEPALTASAAGRGPKVSLNEGAMFSESKGGAKEDSCPENLEKWGAAGSRVGSICVFLTSIYDDGDKDSVASSHQDGTEEESKDDTDDTDDTVDRTG